MFSVKFWFRSNLEVSKYVYVCITQGSIHCYLQITTTSLNHRLEATSPAAPEMGTALVGRPSRRLTDEQKKKAKCHNCGQIGHIRPDCPTKPSKSPGKSDQARVAAAEKKMNGSKSKQSKQKSSSASEGDDSDYDAIGFSAFFHLRFVVIICC